MYVDAVGMNQLLPQHDLRFREDTEVRTWSWDLRSLKQIYHGTPRDATFEPLDSFRVIPAGY